LLPAAAGIIVLAVWCVIGARRGGRADALAVLWGLGVVFHLAIYLMLRPPPYHWYYGPVIAALTMLGVFGVDALPFPITPPRCSPRWAGSAAAALLIAGSALFLFSRPWQIMPISSNWASASEYSALAARLPRGATVQTFGEVGTVAFFAHGTVVDRFSDRAQVVKLIRAKRAEAGPLTRALIDINYYQFTANPPIHPVYRFAFTEDPSGVTVTSAWRPYGGQMVVQFAPHQP
ncbi:MAG TPA: hypothetical protein VFO16_03720, partial [Pseudonocardiaceae bacterium]|nr:hypothetical protein [Pseudonocardiaceae bacterium]